MSAERSSFKLNCTKLCGSSTCLFHALSKTYYILQTVSNSLIVCSWANLAVIVSGQYRFN